MCKNQKISLHFSYVSSPHPSAAKRKKKWKGIFWFCFAVSVSEKSTISLSLLIALFSALTATEAHPYPRLAVALTSANHTQRIRIARSLRSRWLLRRCACSLVASRERGGNSERIWIVLRTNKSVCACPARPVRAQQPPAVFRGPARTPCAPRRDEWPGT